MALDPITGLNKTQQRDDIPTDIRLAKRLNLADLIGGGTLTGTASGFNPKDVGHSIVEVIQRAIDENRITGIGGSITAVVNSLAGNNLTTTVNGVSSTPITLPSGGVTNLGYIPATRTVTSNTGTDAVISAASETVEGLARFGTSAEVTAGTLTDVSVNPANLKVELDKKLDGTLSDSNIYVGDGTNTPQGVAMSGDASISNTGIVTVLSASTTQAGKVELANNTETDVGSSTTLAITPAGGEATYIKKSVGTTKGDLLAFSAANTPVRVPVGDDFSDTISDSSTISGRNYRKNNPTATTDPTASESGYMVLSRWVNTNTGEVFVCIDNTVGANVWVSLTQSGGTADGFTTAPVRTNNTTNVAPTVVEHPSPKAGDTSLVQLLNKNIVVWTYNTAWALQYTIIQDAYRYTNGQAEIWATDLGVTFTINTTTGEWEFESPANVKVLKANVTYLDTDTEDGTQDVYLKMSFTGARDFNTSLDDAMYFNGYILQDTVPSRGTPLTHFYFNAEGTSGNSILVGTSEIGGGDGSDIEWKLTAPVAATGSNIANLTFNY